MNAWMIEYAWLWQLAGWTMLHFLWIGALVAVIGGALRLACRRAAPNVRYAASLVTLAALAAAPIAIAAWLTANPVATELAATRRYSAAERADAVETRSATASRLTPPQTSPPELAATRRYSAAERAAAPAPSFVIPHSDFVIPASPPPTFVIRISDFVIPLVPYLPWTWLVGAPLTFLLLAGGLVGSHRLRRDGTPLADGPAYDACRRLCASLGMTCRVSLAACDRIAQPVLVGIFQPLILLPTAALAGWTPAELEMVLLHELAHVRRGDNLVNLLQRIVESLLFFHPAVWLASRQVRRDREECCDAIVVARTERPNEYAELLVSIAAALRGRRSPALASAMADHPLAGRIRRILKLENEPMRVSLTTMAAALVAPLLIASAFYAVALGDDALDSPPSKGEQSSAIGENQTPTNVPIKAPSDDAESAVKKIAEFERQAENARKSVEFWNTHQRAALNGSSHLADETIDLLASGLANNDPEVQELLRVLQEASKRVRAVMDGEVEVPDDLDEHIRALREAREAHAAAKAKAKASHRKQYDDNPDLVLETTIKEHAQAVRSLKETEAKLAAAKERLLQIEPSDERPSLPQSQAPAVRPLHVYLAVPQLKAAGTEQERANQQQTLQTLVRSPQVISSVLQAPEVAELGSVKAQPNAAAWLAARLRASFPGSGLELKIGGASYNGAELLEMQFNDEGVESDDRVILKALFSVVRDIVYARNSSSAQVDAPREAAQEAIEPEPDQSYLPEVSVVQWPVSAGDKTTAYLKVKFRMGDRAFTDASQQPTPQEMEKQSMSHLALILSPTIVKRALQEPELRTLSRVNDPPHWVAKRVKVSFPGDGEILEMRIEGTDESAETDRKLLTGLINAYLAELKTTASPPAGGGDAPAREETTREVFRYDGKTFDEWRSQWKHELKIERRIDAIDALAAFARAGYASQAAEAILDVAGEYDFSVYNIGDESPEGKLRNAILQQLWSAKLSPTDWLPLLMERMTADQAKWRSLAEAIFHSRSYWAIQQPLDAETRTLLIKMASEPQYEPNAAVLSALRNEKDERVFRLIKSALTGDDAANALEVLGLLGFRNLDDVPEQFELLFHTDADVRREARTALATAPDRGDFDVVVERLLSVLNDPERTQDRADAIRALAVLIRLKLHVEQKDATKFTVSMFEKQVAPKLVEIARQGPVELIAPTWLAMSGRLKPEDLLADADLSPEDRRLQLKEAGAQVAGERERLVDSENARVIFDVKEF